MNKQTAPKNAQATMPRSWPLTTACSESAILLTISVSRVSPVDAPFAPVVLALEIPRDEDGEEGIDDRRRWNKMAGTRWGMGGVHRESMAETIDKIVAAHTDEFMCA